MENKDKSTRNPYNNHNLSIMRDDWGGERLFLDDIEIRNVLDYKVEKISKRTSKLFITLHVEANIGNRTPPQSHGEVGE